MAGKTHIEPALLELYVLGLTTEAESKEVELYLVANPTIAKEVKNSQSAMADFASEYVGESPKKSKGKFLENIKSLFRR